MERIITQLLDLLWGALPTTVIVFFLFFFLRWAFWRPLERVLAERQAASEGTRREAEELLKRANEKLQQYEEALRQARADIYRRQEAQRQEALAERHQLLAETRRQAQEMIRRAKLDLAADLERAKKDLEAESERLADLIARALLARPGRPATPLRNPGDASA